MATTAEIIAKVVQFFTASDKAHLLVNGPASGPGSMIPTEAGDIPTFPYLAANYEPVLLGKQEKTQVHASFTNPLKSIIQIWFTAQPADLSTMELYVYDEVGNPITVTMVFRDDMNYTGSSNEVNIGTNYPYSLNDNVIAYLDSYYVGTTGVPFSQVLDSGMTTFVLYMLSTDPSHFPVINGSAGYDTVVIQTGQNISPVPTQVGQDILVGTVEGLDLYEYTFYHYDGYRWVPRNGAVTPNDGYIYWTVTGTTAWLNRVLGDATSTFGRVGFINYSTGDVRFLHSSGNQLDLNTPTSVSGSQTLAVMSQVVDLASNQSIWGTKTFYNVVKLSGQTNNDSNGGTLAMTRDLLPQEQLFSHHQVRNSPVISAIQVNGTADMANDGQTFGVNAVAGAYGIGRFTRNINTNPTLSGAPNRVDGQLAFSFIIGAHIAGIAYKAIRFRCGVAGTAPPMMDQAPLTGRGFGFEIFHNATTARVEIRAFAHNGTTLTYSAAPGSPAGALGPAFAMALSNVAHVMIQSNGAGQVALYGSVGNGITIPRASMTALCLIATAGPSGANTYIGDYTDFGMVGHTTNAVGVAQVKLIDSIMKLG